MSKSAVIGVVVGVAVFTIGSLFVPSPRCADGTRSSSIGKSGACSHHGGVYASLWNIPLLIGSIVIGSKTYTIINRRKKKEPPGPTDSPYGNIDQYAAMLRAQGIDEVQIQEQIKKYKNN